MEIIILTVLLSLFVISGLKLAFTPEQPSAYNNLEQYTENAALLLKYKRIQLAEKEHENNCR